jgi:hypothetical protein
MQKPPRMGRLEQARQESNLQPRGLEPDQGQAERRKTTALGDGNQQSSGTHCRDSAPETVTKPSLQKIASQKITLSAGSPVLDRRRPVGCASEINTGISWIRELESLLDRPALSLDRPLDTITTELLSPYVGSIHRSEIVDRVMVETVRSFTPPSVHPDVPPDLEERGWHVFARLRDAIIEEGLILGIHHKRVQGVPCPPWGCNRLLTNHAPPQWRPGTYRSRSGAADSVTLPRADNVCQWLRGRVADLGVQKRRSEHQQDGIGFTTAHGHLRERLPNGLVQ